MFSQALRQNNVNLTIFRRIKNLVDAGTYSGRVFYEDALADPTALNAANTALRYWFEVAIVSGGVGLKLPTIVQVDCYYVTGTPGNQSSSDRYGHKVQAMAVDFQSAFAGSSSGVGFKVYDFSTDASNPTETTEWLIPRNSRGQFGWVEEVVRMPSENGLQRVVMTLHVWHHEDLMGMQAYV